SFSARSSPRPIPAHECSVVPPIFTDAMPVDAVIASLSGLPGSLRALIISRRRTDFPMYQPAEPVKKTFSPCATLCRMARCS
ncbi:hypothetical protein FA95DRAFT_1463630, partial [Auriscalpium vulgare]